MGVNKCFSLKLGMLLGAASAATQIEGGDLGHSWNRWYDEGHIKDGSNPSRANNHYNLVDEDIELMKEVGIQVYRFGIEWARIEPSPGMFSMKVIEHYKDLLDKLKKAGIKPLVTLHHFTNPGWFEDMGAFTKKENTKYFLRFVKKVVTAFGELASEYITINEPNVYAVSGYFFGMWPPGEKSFQRTVLVMSNMAYCHIKAYDLIHKIRQELGFTNTMVSFANHVRIFEPENKYNPWHIICTKLMEYLFEDALNQAFYKGVFKWPLGNSIENKNSYCDFIAVNYYTRTTVTGIKDGVRKGVKTNDLGWEIYPKGLIRCAEKLYDLHPRPIYITENGTCDNTDAFRSRYIYDHLKVISESDLPIVRYYHWCFCDNFEWVEGESSRFGLVHVDYNTQKRTIKNSGHFYSRIIKDGGVSKDIYQKYVQDSTYS